MKEGKNIFFHGRTHDPHPRKLGLEGLLSQTSPQACGVAGLIKNIFLPSFMCYFLFFSISHVDAAPPRACHLDNCVAVEVVSKPEDMQRGLMYREGLQKDAGMLFIFSSDDIHQFWMKNMSFNLDIVWISNEDRIVFIGPGIPACKQGPCPVYGPQEDSRYVLEVNSGYAASHGWKVGDKLRLEGI